MIFRFFKLALKRTRSIDDYRDFQYLIGEASINQLQDKGYDLSNLCVLEIGSGYGGYSKILKEKTGTLIAADLMINDWYSKNSISFVQLDGGKPFPFKKDTFDFVYCSSLIEHIADPSLLLQSIWKVTKPGGIVYLTFPPFYTLALIGGHNFKPFHFLGEKFAVRLTNFLYRSNITSYASAYGVCGLFPLTIDQVESVLLERHFEIIEKYSRLCKINTTHLPGILKDLATWHICFITKKPIPVAG
jgi:SAM-dependent methyltransferase